MALKTYQTAININKLYSSVLLSPSGLGEALKPRITSIGATVDIYGSEEEPVGLTIANIATKMAPIKTDVSVTDLYVSGIVSLSTSIPFLYKIISPEL